MFPTRPGVIPLIPSPLPSSDSPTFWPVWTKDTMLSCTVILIIVKINVLGGKIACCTRRHHTSKKHPLLMSWELEMLEASTQTSSSSPGRQSSSQQAVPQLYTCEPQPSRCWVKVLEMREILWMRLSYTGWLTSRVVLQWRGFMSWLFLSGVSESWYDDESHPCGFGCEDRMVLAALLSPLISALQLRQCSWVRQDSEMRSALGCKTSLGEIRLIIGFKKLSSCGSGSQLKKKHKLVGQDYLWSFEYIQWNIPRRKQSQSSLLLPSTGPAMV